MYILAPSLLAADFTKLGEQIKETERCGAQFLHIDVMDGIFVPSISFGMPLIESIRPATKQFFDVHLMIVEPERYIQEFVDCGADGITFHLEATKNPQKVIDQIHRLFGIMVIYLISILLKLMRYIIEVKVVEVIGRI